MAELLVHGRVVLLDDVDLELVSGWDWNIVRHSNDVEYALRHVTRNGVRTTQGMHRLITDERWLVVDHINRNGLDNRRENLREVSHRQNQWNRMRNRSARSQYKGLSLRRDTGRWWARIQVGEKRLSLGTWATEEEAAYAYDRAAREHYGEFALLNFPADVMGTIGFGPPKE